MLQQVGSDRLGETGLLQLVHLDLLVLVIEYRYLAPGVHRKVADMPILRARLPERPELREYFLIAPVEHGYPVFHVIAYVQGSIHIRRQRAELGRIAEKRLQLLGRETRDQFAVDAENGDPPSTFHDIHVFLGVDADMGRFVEVGGSGAVSAEGLQEQALLVEHADLLVLDITDVDILVNRRGDRSRTVEFAGAATGLREQHFRFQVRTDDAHLAVVLGDDYHAPVGEHVDTAKILVLERFGRQLDGLDVAVGNLQQGSVFGAGDIDDAVIGYLQPAGVFEYPGIVLGFDKVKNFKRVDSTGERYG